MHPARSLPLALGLSALLLPSLAHAAGNPADEARLEYLRGPGAESCPGEEALRNGVAAQMGGADPFTAYGSKRVVVTISRGAHGFDGEFALFSAAGALVGRRPMGASTCAGLAQDLATSLSLALRPFLLPSAPTAPQLSPPFVPDQPSPAPPSAPPPATRPDFRIGVGASMGFGLSPAIVSPGCGGFVGVRWPGLSLSLEGRGDLGASTDGPSRRHLLALAEREHRSRSDRRGDPAFAREPREEGAMTRGCSACAAALLMVLAPRPVGAFELSAGVSLGGIQAGTVPRFAVSPGAAIAWRTESGFMLSVDDLVNIVPPIQGSKAGVDNHTSIAFGYAWVNGSFGAGPSLSIYSLPACGAQLCGRVVGLSPGAHLQASLYFAGPLGVSVSAEIDWMGGRSLVLPGGVAAMVVAGPVFRLTSR
jgi:hypothetical protein